MQESYKERKSGTALLFKRQFIFDIYVYGFNKSNIHVHVHVHVYPQHNIHVHVQVCFDVEPTCMYMYSVLPSFKDMCTHA